MSYQEFLQWAEYRRRFGPLNPMLRVDAAFARFSVLIAQLTGNKRKVSDYMPYLPHSDEPATLDDIKKLLG